MATPADRRLLDLLDKGLKSLELHAKDCALDDDGYWKIQRWAEHQRPTRWIIDLAMQKTLALRTEVVRRMAEGDATYSDSLELMIFLANLVGSEHIERFIPVAEAGNENAAKEPAAPGEPEPTGQKAPHRRPDSATAARIPKPPGTRRPSPPGAAHAARGERKSAAQAAPPRKAAAAAKSKISDDARAQVAADAARLINWGRKWYELPDLIARMAGRPPLADVRRILRENKSAIVEKAGSA